MNNYIIKELDSSLTDKVIDKKKYITESNDDILNTTVTETIPDVECMLILTKNGYLKKIPSDKFKSQNRGGKGISTGNIKDDDIIKSIISSNYRHFILLFTAEGYVFKYLCNELPDCTLNSYGYSIKNKVKDQNIISILSVTEEELNDTNLSIISCSKYNKIKMTPITEFKRLGSGGIKYTDIYENDSIISVASVNNSRKFSVYVINSKGYSINISKDKIPLVGRICYGSNVFDSNEINNKTYIVNALIIEENTSGILLITENGFGKRVSISEFPEQNRGGVGRIAIKFKTAKDGLAVALPYTDEEEKSGELTVISNENVIKMKLDDVNLALRPAFGITVKKVKNKEKVVDACIS